MKREKLPPAQSGARHGGVQPGHMLLLGIMAFAAASLFVTRGTGTVNMVAVAVAILTTGLVAAAVYRSLMPLTAADVGEQTDMLGGRTRAALEREKMLVLRSIKEIEFDHAMRKISDADYQEMLTRLRVRAAGLIRQLDGGAGCRDLIECDLAKLVGGSVPVPQAPVTAPAPAQPSGICPSCAVDNGTDARFCKSCGARLGGQS